MRILACLAVCLSLITNAALGHEFWISPQKYRIAPGETLLASLRVGQNFSGASVSYLPPRFRRFDLVRGERILPVAGRLGDDPALSATLPEPGLWIVVHETADSILTWDGWEDFAAFVRHKDLGDTLERHVARGLPPEGFRERYRRFAKALIAVGAGQGRDSAQGLRTELVALDNPYADDPPGGLRILLLFAGRPRADAQIEIFEKAPGGQVTVSTRRTDAAGIATIPLRPGHEYLLDAVTMLPLENAGDPAAPAWESLWASLTFRVPPETP